MYNIATLTRARTYKLRNNSIFGYLTDLLIIVYSVTWPVTVQAINSVVIPIFGYFYECALLSSGFLLTHIIFLLHHSH